MACDSPLFAYKHGSDSGVVLNSQSYIREIFRGVFLKVDRGGGDLAKPGYYRNSM